MPGEPGSSILARRKVVGDHKKFVMFPGLDDMSMELFFYSRAFDVMIQVEFCDLFAKCPAGHIWVYCCGCQKLFWGSHRASK